MRKKNSVNFLNFFLMAFVFNFIFVVSVYCEHLKLTFFYTNDMHGNIKAYTIARKDLSEPFLGGGFAIMKKYIDAYKEKNADRIIVLTDSGDIFQGTPEGDLTDGILVIEGMNKLGYDFTTLGNHEFDRGEDVLIRLIDKMDFSVVSANVESAEANLKKYVIKNYNDKINIAFTGVLTMDTKKILGENALKNFDIKDERESLKNVLSDIKKENYDFIVLLSHCGTGLDSEIVSVIPDFDLVFGGHDHFGKVEPLILPNSKTMMFSTWGRLSTLGQLELEFDNKEKKIVKFENKLVDLREELGKDEEMEKFIAERSADIDKTMNVEIGYTDDDLFRMSENDSYYASSRLGNVITAVIKEKAAAQISFYNNSGIRNSIVKGKLTFRDVYQVEPFGNTIYTMKLKGSDIRQFMSEVLNDNYHGVQIAGLKIEYYQNSADSQFYLEKITLADGSELIDDEYYLTATPNYIGGGNDGYTVFLKGIEKKDLLVSILDTLVENFKKNNPYKYNFENRIIFKGIK